MNLSTTYYSTFAINHNPDELTQSYWKYAVMNLWSSNDCMSRYGYGILTELRNSIERGNFSSVRIL